MCQKSASADFSRLKYGDHSLSHAPPLPAPSPFPSPSFLSLYMDHALARSPAASLFSLSCPTTLHVRPCHLGAAGIGSMRKNNHRQQKCQCRKYKRGGAQAGAGRQANLSHYLSERSDIFKAVDCAVHSKVRHVRFIPPHHVATADRSRPCIEQLIQLDALSSMCCCNLPTMNTDASSSEHHHAITCTRAETPTPPAKV